MAKGHRYLWLLGSLCRLSRVPFDAALLAQNFPPPHSRSTLREAAQALGFSIGELAMAKADRTAVKCGAAVKCGVRWVDEVWKCGSVVDEVWGQMLPLNINV